MLNYVFTLKIKKKKHRLTEIIKKKLIGFGKYDKRYSDQIKWKKLNITDQLV